MIFAIVATVLLAGGFFFVRSKLNKQTKFNPAPLSTAAAQPAPSPASSAPAAPATAEAKTAQPASVQGVTMSVRAALDALAATEKKIVVFNGALKPGYYTGGSRPDDKPLADSWTRVVSLPQGLPPMPNLGVEATQLGYDHGTGYYKVIAAQDAAHVARNKPGEIYHAADSGDYSKINGA